MPSDLCRRAKELARRFDKGPALTQCELATWWRFRDAIASGDIDCVASDEVLPVEVSIGGQRFTPGTKLQTVVAAIRKSGRALVAASIALLLDAHATCDHYTEIWW